MKTATRRALAGAFVLAFATAGAAAEEEARRILDATGVRGGLVVHVGCGDGALTAALRAGEGYLVHGLDAEAGNVARARAAVRARGLYGAVSIDRLRGERLPYADNLVNLVVSEDLGEVSMAEVMRVLAPNGVAYIRRARPGKAEPVWSRTVKPRPEDMDEWTHFLHAPDGNAVSRDMHVGRPERLRWVAGPTFSRHHDEVLATSAMVTGGGHIFSIVDEAPRSTFHPYIGGKFSLIARDAFNGLVLWRKPVKDWGWKVWGARQNTRFAQPIQLPKRMVVDGETLYVTLGWNAPVSVLDARTGALVKVLGENDCADELLLADGKLVLSVYDKPTLPAKAAEAARKARTKPPGIRKRIQVVDVSSGRKLWESDRLDGLSGRFDAVAPQTHLELTLRAGRVFALTRDTILCFSLRDGKRLWARPRPERPTHRMMLGVNMGDNCTVLADDERLYVAQPVGKLRNTFHTIPCDLYAYDASSGRQLWTLPRTIGSFAWGIHADVFLIGGKLWSHEHIDTRMKGAAPVDSGSIKYALLGISPRTGAIEKRIDTRTIFNIAHHHRCYRNNATERFVLSARRGTELTDLESGAMFVNHWLRGECRFGMVPANGLLYAPPDPCSCHARIKVNGMLALAAGAAPKADTSARLVKGPAYGRVPASAAGEDDWPMHRRNSRRQGFAARPVNALRPAWKVDLGDTITQAMCVGNQVFVSCRDTHRIAALDAGDGKVLWSFTASGRIDSPPTFSGGHLLFGSADGCVYCLRAADGQLAWTFRAAPAACLIVARGQLESAWPVHGSVLVHENVACVVAGRSSYLDGGIHAFALDVATGEVRKYRHIASAHNDKTSAYSEQTFDAEGALNHLLVSDGRTVYLQSKPLFDGKTAEAPARCFLAATCGMLDGSMFSRYGWGFVGASGATGTQIVHDDNRLYATRATRSFNRSTTFIVGSGYSLMEADLPAQPEAFAQFEKSAFAFLGYRAPKIKPNWQCRIPVRGQAMLLMSNALLVAGLPDEISESDPYGAFEGRKGGKLLVIDRKTGKTRSEAALDSPPVWDGISFASKRVFVAQGNGRLVCFACE